MKSCLWVTLVVLLAKQLCLRAAAQTHQGLLSLSFPHPTRSWEQNPPGTQTCCSNFPFQTRCVLLLIPHPPSLPVLTHSRMSELLSPASCLLLEHPNQSQGTILPSLSAAPAPQSTPGTQLLVVAAVLPRGLSPAPAPRDRIVEMAHLNPPHQRQQAGNFTKDNFPEDLQQLR